MDNDSQKIQEAVQKELRNLPNFIRQIENKDIIVCLGNTRSGKSTLINFLISTELEAISENRWFKIKKANENSVGPIIGQGSASCTNSPGVYQSDRFGIIVDTPGFDDNRGVDQDIVNSLYISQIKHANSVKFVLVSDIADIIRDNIKGFTDLIKKMHMLLPNSESLQMSSSIVFCKDNREYPQTELADLLQTRIANVEQLDCDRVLPSYFAAHPELIGSFRMPTNVGIVSNDINVNVDAAILSSEFTSSNIEIVFSEQSRLVLSTIYLHYLDNNLLTNELNDIIAPFKNYFSFDDYVFASTEDELKSTNTNLRTIILSIREEMYQQIHNLNQIKRNLNQNHNLNVSDKFNFLVIIDDAGLMEPTIKNKFFSQYKTALQNLISKIEKLQSKIDSELKERKELTTQAFVGLGGAATGGLTAAGGATAMIKNNSRWMSGGGWATLIGLAVTAAGAAVAGTTCFIEIKKNKKRMEARYRQGRCTVTSDMF